MPEIEQLFDNGEYPIRIRPILGDSPGETSMRKTIAFIKNIGEIRMFQMGEILKHCQTRNHRKQIQEHYGLEQYRLEEINLTDEIIDQPISILLGINVGLNQQVIDPTSLNLFSTPVIPSLPMEANTLTTYIQ